MHKCCKFKEWQHTIFLSTFFFLFMKTLTKVITYSVEDNNKNNFNWADEIINITTKKRKRKKRNGRTWNVRRGEKKGKTKTIKLRIWPALTAYNYTNTGKYTHSKKMTILYSGWKWRKRQHYRSMEWANIENVTYTASSTHCEEFYAQKGFDPSDREKQILKRKGKQKTK